MLNPERPVRGHVNGKIQHRQRHTLAISSTTLEQCRQCETDVYMRVNLLEEVGSGEELPEIVSAPIHLSSICKTGWKGRMAAQAYSRLMWLYDTRRAR